MEVTLLYIDGCPNHHDAEIQLRQVLDELGWEGSITKVDVTTIEQAEQLRFSGSPTVLIDGSDPFADEEAPVGLACRIYHTGGGFQGTPPTDALREALRRTMNHEGPERRRTPRT